MSYGTPVTSNQIVYTATFENVGTPSGAAAITVKMEQGGEGGLTESQQDTLFQNILDLLADSAFVQVTNESVKVQRVDTVVTPTE